MVFFAIHSCTARYVGEFCEYKNPCLTAPRCQNGGTCRSIIRDGQSTFECECPMGYSASLCEISENTACSSSPCQHNGECVLKSLEEFECRCQEGFSGLCEFFLSKQFLITQAHELLEYSQACLSLLELDVWFQGHFLNASSHQILIIIYLFINRKILWKIKSLCILAM